MITERLPLRPAPGQADILLHLAQPSSRLGRLRQTPYWAYCWAGGLALVRHLFAHPNLVAGRSVLDLGAGSGLVGIAAARCGADSVLAAEANAYGRAAIALNAHANQVSIDVLPRGAPPAAFAIVLAGDVFYAEEVAEPMLAELRAHRQRGAEVLIGDPYRRFLPLDALTQIAAYEVPDMGEARRSAGIFRLREVP